MSDWVTLRHDETDGTTRVPDHPDVIASHEARGWVLVDEAEPERAPFVPAPTDTAPGEEWVELVHPDLPTAVHRVPNDAGALQGAYDSGWRLPEPEKPKRNTATDKGSAAEAAAVTKQTAGDGAQKKE